MTKTVPYREIMKENGQNLGWCRPYKSNDGKIEIVVLESEITMFVENGEFKELAKPIDTKDFDFSNYKEKGCRDCFWFDICCAMDEDYEL